MPWGDRRSQYCPGGIPSLRGHRLRKSFSAAAHLPESRAKNQEHSSVVWLKATGRVSCAGGFFRVFESVSPGEGEAPLA